MNPSIGEFKPTKWEKTKKENGIEKTKAIEKRFKDKCDEWVIYVLLHYLACLKMRAAKLHAWEARYRKDCLTFFSGLSPRSYASK